MEPADSDIDGLIALWTLLDDHRELLVGKRGQKQTRLHGMPNASPGVSLTAPRREHVPSWLEPCSSLVSRICEGSIGRKDSARILDRADEPTFRIVPCHPPSSHVRRRLRDGRAPGRRRRRSQKRHQPQHRRGPVEIVTDTLTSPTMASPGGLRTAAHLLKEWRDSRTRPGRPRKSRSPTSGRQPRHRRRIRTCAARLPGGSPPPLPLRHGA